MDRAKTYGSETWTLKENNITLNIWERRMPRKIN